MMRTTMLKPERQKKRAVTLTSKALASGIREAILCTKHKPIPMQYLVHHRVPGKKKVIHGVTNRWICKVCRRINRTPQGMEKFECDDEQDILENGRRQWAIARMKKFKLKPRDKSSTYTDAEWDEIYDRAIATMSAPREQKSTGSSSGDAAASRGATPKQ